MPISCHGAYGFNGLRVILAAALILLCGCESREALIEQAEPIGRDSAGVQIVEVLLPRPDEAPTWSVADEPLLEIGGAQEIDPDRHFGHIVGAHRQSDGGIVVVDALSTSVLFFRSDGSLDTRAGRVGQGPGEFADPSAIRRSFACGDTVFVATLRMIHAFAPEEGHVRSFRVESNQDAGTPTPVLCMGGHLLVQTDHSNWRTEPGVFVDSILLALHDTEGRREATIDSLPLADRYYAQGPHGGTGYAPVPFGAVLAIAGREGTLVTGFPRNFQVDVRDAMGAVRRIIRQEGRPRIVTEADARRFGDFVFSRWLGNEGERRSLEDRINERVGQPVPAFSELLVDATQNVWIRTFDHHRDATASWDVSRIVPSRGVAQYSDASPDQEYREWIVLSREGRYRATVSMRSQLTVHEIGDDWVLGVWRDALDVQSLRLYRLLRSDR